MGATQSSTVEHSGGPGLASKAIDGSKNTDFRGRSCTHTASDDENASWSAHLPPGQTIDAINIWGRTDCCEDRLHDARIYIDDKLCTIVDNKFTSITDGLCIGAQTSTGSFIKVAFEGKKEILPLCEVEVTGHATTTMTTTR